MIILSQALLIRLSSFTLNNKSKIQPEKFETRPIDEVQALRKMLLS